MEDISVRLKKALNMRNMKSATLAEKSGINKGSISSYLSARYKPNATNIYKMAKILDVSESWLLGYDTNIDREWFEEDNVISEIEGNKEIKDIIDGYNNLSKEDKELIKNIIETRKKQSKEKNSK